jgi:hypothetical protein
MSDNDNKKQVIYSREYHGFESLSDIGRDVEEAFDANFNPLMDDIPGEFQGTMTVTITFTPASEDKVCDCIDCVTAGEPTH